MRDVSPFRLMWTVFIGLLGSLAYGALGAIAVYFVEGGAECRLFLEAYAVSFKTVISFGLILGTALSVFLTQRLIPDTVEEAFEPRQLSQTKYFIYKKIFESGRHSVSFSAQFLVVAFLIFTACSFPLHGLGEILMMVAACAEYALGVYVGRKLLRSGLMLRALMKIKVERNLFKNHELDEINPYVNIIAALTIVFVYLHVRGYHTGPFLYDQTIGASVQTLLLVPAFIATPVLLIFNFYPRMVLGSLYSQSIDVEIERLKDKLKSDSLSEFERMSYVIEFSKMSRDELRYRLRLTLSDLPIGITILVMALTPLVSK